MTVVMRDSVNPQHLANWPGNVAGYIDGRISAWPMSAWHQFIGRSVRITTLANPIADVFDVENGNAPALEVKAAISKRANAGLESIVYTSKSRWAEVSHALGMAGWIGWWIADWTGKAHLLDGTVATQYISMAPYDESLVAPDAWPNFPLPFAGSMVVSGNRYRVQLSG